MARQPQYNQGEQSDGESGIVSHLHRGSTRFRRASCGQEVFNLLTEAEVQRSFRNLFKSKDVPPETFDKAENLLDELRPESPLRHRLSIELEELRKMHTARA